MSFEQKPNSGALFKAEKKEESHADYSGTVNINGKEYWINAWVKESKTGSKFFSLSFKPKEKPAEAKKMVDKAKSDFVDDENIPF